jgi:filamentous hemagglutinin family protein
MRYLLLITALCSPVAHAEVITDGSLGARVALPGKNYEITPTLGQQMGGNLFHSFEKFDLSAGESATFSGANTVQNIIGRVTSGTASQIDGTIRSSIPNAELYLLNPSGVVFGRNAKLEVQGSFHVSTADVLRLGTDGQFNATAPSNSLLSSAAPTAFGFLTATPADLTSEGAQFAVPTGKTLSFVAGDIDFHHSIENNQAQLTKLSATNGRINLISDRAVGEVALQPDGVITPITLGDIKLTAVQMSSNDGGNIYIRAGEFVLSNSLVALQTGTRAGGELNIKANNVIITNGSRITTTALIARAGNVSIQATDTIRLDGQDSQNLGSYITSNTRSKNKAGVGGTIHLQARRVELKDGAKLGVSSYGAADGGELQIQAEEVRLDGADKQTPSSVYLVATDGGQGGTLKLQANRLSLSNGTYIGADTNNVGNGGNMNINVQELTLSGLSSDGKGSYISSNTQSIAENAGLGGQLNITAQQLKLSDGAQITASTLGKGLGGKIQIQASQVALSGQDNMQRRSGIFSIAGTAATGHAGQIEVVAEEIQMHDSGEINAGTYGKGEGGDISVAANKISLNNHSRITALSRGTGDAGSVNLNFADSLLLDNSSVETMTESAAGGSLFISVPKVLYLWNSRITTSVHGGFGNGGNISINQPKFVILNNSKTIAQADAGRGGDINIISKEFLRSTESLVSASSRLGIDGNVFISAPDADLSGDLIVLSSDFLQADSLLKTPCASMDSENLGSFVIAQREGVANYQDDLQASPPVFEAIAPPTTTTAAIPANAPLHKRLLLCSMNMNDFNQLQ